MCRCCLFVAERANKHRMWNQDMSVQKRKSYLIINGLVEAGVGQVGNNIEWIIEG